jgi:hypothetical protein
MFVGCEVILTAMGLLAPHESAWLREVVGWFEAHLHSPRDASPGWTWRGKPWRRGARAPLFWFKAQAREHVQRMQQLIVMLRHHDVPARMMRSARPGEIVYEDGHQVGAVPFRDTPR